MAEAIELPNRAPSLLTSSTALTPFAEVRSPARALNDAFGANLQPRNVVGARLVSLIEDPPPEPLSAFQGKRPVPVTGAAFDPVDAARLEALLAE